MTNQRAVGWFIRILASAILCAASGCASGSRPSHDLSLHVLQFDSDGNTVNVETGRRMEASEREAKFKEIIDNIHKNLDGDTNPQVIFYVHGGLNTPDTAIANAQTNVEKIAHSPEPGTYPIFVIWDSNLIDTYGEHLFQVRQGQKDSETRAWAAIDSPIYLVTDLLVAISRVPTTWFQEGATDVDSVQAAFTSVFSYDSAAKMLKSEPATEPDHVELWAEKRQATDAGPFYVELNRLYFEDGHHSDGNSRRQIAISIGEDHSRPIDWLGRGFTYSLFFPAKLLWAPLVDGLGTPAWRDMLRRAQTLVDGSLDFKVRKGTTRGDIRDYVTRGTDGGLDQFVSELAEAAPTDGSTTRPSWNVTLVAHSAGTIVVNDLLRRQIQHEVEHDQRPLRVTNVVYMAAACSIRDFSDTVIPYMQRQEHHSAQFYDLTLHPSAERIEAEPIGFEILPRGSLLCWIDDFLAAPQTPMDRTLGRWDNIVSIPSAFPRDVRGRVTIKAFPLLRPNEKSDSEDALYPQIHGDFSSSAYWDSSFWWADPARNPGDRRMSHIENQPKKLNPEVGQ